MLKTDKVKLTAGMKHILRLMRQKSKTKRLLFYNYKYMGWYLDEDRLNGKTCDGLFERGLITMVVNIPSFARYELTELGKTIEI